MPRITTASARDQFIDSTNGKSVDQLPRRRELIDVADSVKGAGSRHNWTVGGSFYKGPQPK